MDRWWRPSAVAEPAAQGLGCLAKQDGQRVFALRDGRVMRRELASTACVRQPVSCKVSGGLAGLGPGKGSHAPRCTNPA